MTITELYRWAIENGVEDLELGLQYMDHGGEYYGNTAMDNMDVEASIEGIADDDRYVLLYA